MTQKEIHNMLIKADDMYKMQVIKQCGGDIEKIKQFERLLSNIINVSSETIRKACEYMNEELK